MKVAWYEKTFAVLVGVVFGLIVVHAPLSVWLGTQFPGYELLIKSWKEIAMVVALPFAAAMVWRRNLMPTLVRDPIFYCVMGYVAIYCIVVAMFYQGLTATAAGLAIDLRYILFFCLVYVLVKAIPLHHPLLVRIGVIGACIVVGFGTLQLFLPADTLSHIGYNKNTILPYMTVDENHDYIRVNSTLRGPNPLGAYAGMALALVVALWMRGKVVGQRRMIGAGVVAVCSAICVWISYSRSALVAAIIGVLIVVVVAQRVSLKHWVAVLVGGVAVVGVAVALFGSSLIDNVLLHDNPTTGGATSSNALHIESLQDGATRLLSHPLGSGVGTTGSASYFGAAPTIVENQYLFIGHEVGWIGLGLFLMLYGMILVRLWRNRQEWLSLGAFASGIALGLIGLLLPVWADDTVSIVWWGLAAIAIAGGQRGKKLTK